MEMLILRCKIKLKKKLPCTEVSKGCDDSLLRPVRTYPY